MLRDMEQFDRDFDQALRRMWFLGDVHGQFEHIATSLQSTPAADQPRWLVFFG